MAKILGTQQVTLRLSVKMFQQPWTTRSISDHLKMFSMKGYTTNTLAHRDFEQEVDAWQLDYDRGAFCVTFNMETLQAVFEQVKCRNDIHNLFTQKFVNFLASKQALAKPGLSDQARAMAAANMVCIEFTE